MSEVGIVCDSTCDIPPEWLAEHGAKLVPLRVFFGDAGHLDWVDMHPDEFFQRLAQARSLPTTSQPSPADFEAAYAELAEQGCKEIVSVHLSSPLSGTVESATLAAQNSAVPVHVVDTKLVSVALGLIVRKALELRDSGLSGGEIARLAAETAAKTRLYFVLDTLDYLVKGGRAGKAAGLAASLLNIKPILRFNAEGTIEPFKKVKGTHKAVAELAAHVAEESRQYGTMKIALLHAVAPELADELRRELDAAGTDCVFEETGDVGAVIGTYSGPRAVGLGYYPID